MRVVEMPNAGGSFLGGMGETKQMTIAANGRIIRQLIVGMYAEKEKTVVRELMANAFDAHIAAGINDDIDVYLPAAFDPVFIVRDYGIGMTHDFVMRLYSEIGTSTKSESNEMTGMFGIGSKSPFGMCDTFTLRCFDKPGWNGEPFMVGDTDLNATGRIRLYTMSFDENDMPQVNFVFDVIPGEADQIERGGVEVKVPVAQRQRRAILSGIASQQFCWFDRNVKFHTAYEDIADELYTSITTIIPDMYVATMPESSHGEFRVYVRQGFAVYPVDPSKIELPDDTEETLKHLCKDSRALMIDLPIGTADVTTAREHLSYNDTTKKNVARILEEKANEYLKTLHETIGDARDYRVAFNRLCDKSNINKENHAEVVMMSSLVKLCTKQINHNYDLWYAKQPDITAKRIKKDQNGAEIRDANGDPVYEDYTTRPQKKYPEKAPVVSNGLFPEGKAILHTARGNDRSVVEWNLSQAAAFGLTTIVYLLQSHVPEWKERIEAHFHSKYEDQKFQDRANIIVVRCPKRLVEETQKYIDERGLALVVYGEDDIPAPSGNKLARQYSKTSVYEWKYNSFDKNKIEPDYSQPAYYITRCGITHECFAKHPSRKYAGTLPLTRELSNYSLNQIISNARTLGLIDSTTPIYRVTENQAEKIDKTVPGWTHLIDHIALMAELAVKNDPAAAFNASSLSGGHLPNQYQIDQFVSRALNMQSENDAKAFDVLKTLAEHDEWFLCVMGVRRALSGKAPVKSPFNDPNTELYRQIAHHLFGSRDSGGDQKAVEDYNILYNAFGSNYSVFCELLSECEKGYSAANYKHLKYYVNGYVAHEPKKQLPAGKYLDLKPVVDVFSTAIQDAANRRSIFPA